MKTKISIILLIIGTVFFTSCDDTDNNFSIDNSLNGTWNLKKKYGGFSGTSNVL